jgi:flagellar hook assembly protein FlgD
VTALHSNYPNPFNPITTLRFSLREPTPVSLVVYDARGRVARNLIRQGKPWAAGKYRLVWDAKDDRGFELPSGQYFYRFSAGKYHRTRKMILLK